MFKTREGGGGQGLFKQCLKKLHNWYGMASLTGFCPNYVNRKTKGNKHNFSVILNKRQIIHKVFQQSLQTGNKGFPL